MQHKKIYLLSFCLLTAPALTAVAGEMTDAEASHKQHRQRVSERYGKVDAIYPEESRIVIDDMSYSYQKKTMILNQHGRSLPNPEYYLKPGTPVRYIVRQSRSGPVIKMLEMIDKKTLAHSRKLSRDE